MDGLVMFFIPLFFLRFIRVGSGFSSSFICGFGLGVILLLLLLSGPVAVSMVWYGVVWSCMLMNGLACGCLIACILLLIERGLDVESMGMQRGS